MSLANKKEGMILILTVIIMTLLLILGTYFMSFSLSDFKMASAHASAVKAYYLTEAGINEMIYRLKNDPDYESEFTTNESWSQYFSRENALFANASYGALIQNTTVAFGEITASSSLNFSLSSQARRTAKTKAFRATGSSPIEKSGGYADGNINISFSTVNFYNGSAHSNNVFTINGISNVNIDNDLRAVVNYNKSWLSDVDLGGRVYSPDNPPAPEYMPMPAVDFDSSDPNSLKNRAEAIYTSAEFEDLLDNNPNLTLDSEITYVEGDIDIEGDLELTVNGLLVAERDINIGERGFSSITVNSIPEGPSGLFAKRKIHFLTWAGTIGINGLIYANDQLTIQSFPLGRNFEIHGGLVSRKLTITSAWQPINIYYDNNIVINSLNPAFYSPTINTEHWEEQY